MDIWIYDQQIHSNSQKTVALPVYENELTSGFDIMYEIPLSGSLSLLCRGDNKKLRSDQKEVVIDKPVLTGNFGSYLVVVNRGNNSITLAHGNARLPTLERQGNNLVNGGQYEFSPGKSGVYRLQPNSADKLEIEDGQRRTAVSLPHTQDNYLYKVEYSPQGAVLTDARPLTMIGAPVPVEVEFSGDDIPAANREKLVEELDNALRRYQVPFFIAGSESAPWEQLVHHTLIITIATGRQAPRPPLNRELVSGSVAVSLLRNGVAIVQAEDNYKDFFDEASVYSAAARFIREDTSFYNEVIQYVMS
ncbi:hypothetical protein FACS189483_09400 [Spirochaetia bacterium]|nr:hypothetical protein FACS189483_09400 [Spirochaetia bacterium]